MISKPLKDSRSKRRANITYLYSLRVHNLFFRHRTSHLRLDNTGQIQNNHKAVSEIQLMRQICLTQVKTAQHC